MKIKILEIISTATPVYTYNIGGVYYPKLISDLPIVVIKDKRKYSILETDNILPSPPSVTEYCPITLSGSEYNITDLNISFSYSSEIDTRIAGKTGAAKQYRNGWMTSTPTYASTGWLSGITLTAIPLFNSNSHVGSAPDPNAGHGALITPKHLIHTRHGGFYPHAGTSLYFLNSNNEIKGVSVADSTEIDYTDLVVVRLATDVHPSITPISIAYFCYNSFYNNSDPPTQPIIFPGGYYPGRIPVIIIDQQEKTLIHELSQSSNYPENTMFSTKDPQYFINPNHAIFHENLVSWDSGSPVIMLYKNSNNLVVPLLLGLVLSGGPATNGPHIGYYVKEIRKAIRDFGDTSSVYNLNIFHTNIAPGPRVVNFTGSISGTILTVSSTNSSSIVSGMKMTNIWSASQPTGTIKSNNNKFYIRPPVYTLSGDLFGLGVEPDAIEYTNDGLQINTDDYTYPFIVPKPTTDISFTKLQTSINVKREGAKWGTNNNKNPVMFGDTKAALDVNGKVWCWGVNGVNECSVPIGATSDVSKISMGDTFIVALKNGGCTAWGENGQDQCIVPIEAQSNVVDVVCSSYVSMALLNTGQLVFWGGGSTLVWLRTYKRRLLFDDPADPVGLSYLENIVPSKNIVKIFAGLTNFGAIDDTGKLYIWGLDQYGMNKNGTDGLSYDKVSIGQTHVIAKLSNGQIVSWGRNDYGERDIPVIPLGTNIIDFQAHSLVGYPDGFFGPEPRKSWLPESETVGSWQPETKIALSVYLLDNNRVVFTGYGSNYFNTMFSSINITDIKINILHEQYIPFDAGIQPRETLFDLYGNWVWDGASYFSKEDLPSGGIHMIQNFVNISYVNSVGNFKLSDIQHKYIAFEDRPILPGGYLYYGDPFSTEINTNRNITIKSQIDGVVGGNGRYRIDVIGGLTVAATSMQCRN